MHSYYKLATQFSYRRTVNLYHMLGRQKGLITDATDKFELCSIFVKDLPLGACKWWPDCYSTEASAMGGHLLKFTRRYNNMY